MATPADQRLLDLLGRWLESLELHTKYSSLDDDSYWKIQPWSEHQRPSLWILNLAKQKTLALRAHVEERVKTGDARFSDALELMAFLANLVGSEHLERFIPVADKANERPLPSSSADTNTAPAPVVSVTATREMPKFLAAKRSAPPAGTPQVARTERRAAALAKPAVAAKPAPKVQPKPAARKPAPQPEREGLSEAQRDQVIADAARLVQWGRRWFELPELIARMADRPALADVRRILKENKSAIEKKAGSA
jgi:hypothetical protein